MAYRAQESDGFTLIELLVVISIIAVLASILFPVFAMAKSRAKQSVCVSNLRQIGVAMSLYMDDEDGLMPDRRDLKSSLPGGYRPWTSWPPSDPRSGWAIPLLEPYVKASGIYTCPSIQNSNLGHVPQVYQATTTAPDAPSANYWMWRFDRTDDPVPLDNFWGKTEDRAVDDLQAANNPQAGNPQGISDVEIAVDPYFPRTIPSVSASLKGKAVHFGGRNRLFLDWHVKYLKDRRTSP